MGYSEEFLEHMRYPQNFIKLDEPFVVGHADLGSVVPYIDLYFLGNDETIERVTFQTAGCGALVACGSLVSNYLVGVKWEKCIDFSGVRFIEVIGGLPPQKAFCGELVARAVRHAAAQWLLTHG